MVDAAPRVTSPAIDVVATARERQEVRVELLSAQLDRAVDALIAARLALAEAGDDIEARRRVLFDLYDAEIVTKAQVRERGDLDPATFHEHLRAHRLRTVPSS